MNAEVTARRRSCSRRSRLCSTRNATLADVGRDLKAWVDQTRREKAIYHTLNMFSIDVTRKCLVAEGWCPVSAKARVQEALFRANRSSSAQMGTVFQPLATKEAPPTYFATNKVTEVFQGIVEAYGVGRYREVNPPGVHHCHVSVFVRGDVRGFRARDPHALGGHVHGGERKTNGVKPLNEIVQMGFDGRYCILLMSVFSIYTGLLYNECFSVPMSVFGGSKWRATRTTPPRL